MKAEAEKQIGSRTSKIQSTENRLKQREMQINQKQEELNKKSSELDEVRANLESQRAALEKRNQELEKLHQQSLVKLETISGFSAQEAKEQLVESLKDEAKASAQLYIDEIVEEAKMTANKEAKRIVIQTIQRVATETSIENAVTVFHIDSDEVKGRIIGREGAIFVRWRLLRVWKSLWTIHRRLSYCRPLTPYGERLPDCRCISW